MFYTGVFTIGACCVMREHNETRIFNDDVLSWFDEKQKQDFILQPDGYVSNIGNAITIHISKELIGTGFETDLKQTFYLNDDNLEIIIEELDENSSILIY